MIIIQWIKCVYLFLPYKIQLLWAFPSDTLSHRLSKCNNCHYKKSKSEVVSSYRSLNVWLSYLCRRLAPNRSYHHDRDFCLSVVYYTNQFLLCSIMHNALNFYCIDHPILSHILRHVVIVEYCTQLDIHCW